MSFDSVRLVDLVPGDVALFILRNGRTRSGVVVAPLDGDALGVRIDGRVVSMPVAHVVEAKRRRAERVRP